MPPATRPKHPPWLVIPSVAVAVAVAVALAGCGGTAADGNVPQPASAQPVAPAESPPAVGEPAREPTPSAAEQPEAATGSRPAPDAAPQREVAPLLVGTTLDGKPFSTEDYRGRPTFVKFFAWH